MIPFMRTDTLIAFAGGIGVGAGVAAWRARPRRRGDAAALACADVMTTELAVVGTGEPIADAARMMRDLNVGFIPVCQSDKVVLGTITDRDIAVRYVAEGRPPSTTVQDVMSSDLVACAPSDTVDRAAALMRERQVSRVLVLDERHRLLGVISLSDLTQFEDARAVGEVAREIALREV